MSEKRPIDIQREGAVQIEVNAPDDDSAITDIIQIGDSLHAIKQKGIYQIRLADEVDPKRTNPKVPNTYQRVLGYGSENEIVARTLLTAKNLFDPAYLGSSFDQGRALLLTFDALKNLLAMQEVVVSVEETQARAQALFSSGGKKSKGLGLPSVGDLTPQFKSYIQKAHHVLKSLLDIVKLFYGTHAAGQRFQALADLAEERYGKEAQFAQFIRGALPSLQFMWNMRTCVEHPKTDAHIKIRDFYLDPGTTHIVPPTIEVVHPETSQAAVSLTALVKQGVDELASIVEAMIAHLCDRNVERISGFEVRVVEVPLERRRNKNVRLQYQIMLPRGSSGRREE